MNTATTKDGIYRIIIVDDDATECGMLLELLSGPRRCVTAFQSAAEALEFARQNPIDLALLDHVMPGMTGVELAGQIKALHPKIRIVMCTGYLVEASYPEFCEQAERVLHKPLNLGEVLQLVDSP